MSTRYTAAMSGNIAPTGILEAIRVRGDQKVYDGDIAARTVVVSSRDGGDEQASRVPMGQAVAEERQEDAKRAGQSDRATADNRSTRDGLAMHW